MHAALSLLSLSLYCLSLGSLNLSLVSLNIHTPRFLNYEIHILIF